MHTYGASVVCLQEQAKGPKLVLRAENEKQLLEVLHVAQGMCLPTHSIAEATGIYSDNTMIMSKKQHFLDCMLDNEMQGSIKFPPTTGCGEEVIL